YAMNGARHVYALEPYPYFYNIGLKNIQTNKLNKKITLINAGCGSETSKAQLNESDTNFNRVQSKGKSTKGINIMSLNEIVKKYDIRNGSLKVDCEGCEYDIILKTDSNILRRFSYIQIEYHYGYANLLERLKEAGFKVEYTKPLKKYNFVTSSFMVIGFINARRL
ncbi:MAG: FkbM family methyltransferase, partial [Candidatus Micrarchaeaceae archaeon]